MAKKKTYKMYAGGGWMDKNSGAVQAGATFLADTMTSFERPNKANVGLKTGEGALTGAAAGTAVLPGIGTAVGAGIGAVSGLVGGLAEKKRLRQEQEIAAKQYIDQATKQSAARYSAYDTQGQQGVQYFADGGEVENPQYEVEKGEVVQGNDTNLEEQNNIASDLTVAGGATHENGGTLGEGGDRVYSDRIKLSSSALSFLEGAGINVKKGATYAEAATLLGKKKGEAEEKTESNFYPSKNTGKREANRIDTGLDVLFNLQESEKGEQMATNKFAQGGGLDRSEDYGSKKKPYPSVESGDFAGGGRSYPIPTRADAVDALRLAGLHGRSDVKAKVYAKYPDLKKKAYGGLVPEYANGGLLDVPTGPRKPGDILAAGQTSRAGGVTTTYQAPVTTPQDWGGADYVARTQLDASTTIDPITEKLRTAPTTIQSAKPAIPVNRAMEFPNAIPLTRPSYAPVSHYALGGNIGDEEMPEYAGGGRNFKSGAAYKAWLAYGHASGEFAKTPGHQDVSIRGKAKTVEHAQGGNLPDWLYEARGNKFADGGNIGAATRFRTPQATGVPPEPDQSYQFPTATTATQNLADIRQQRAVTEDPTFGTWTPEGQRTDVSAPTIAMPTAQPESFGQKLATGIQENQGQLLNLGSYLANLGAIKKISTTVPRTYVPLPSYEYTDRSGLAKANIQQAFRTAQKGLTSTSSGGTAANLGAAYAKTLDALNQAQQAENVRRDQYRGEFAQRMGATQAANVAITNQALDQELALKNRKYAELPVAARNALLQGIMGNVAVKQQKELDKTKMALSGYLYDQGTGVMGRLPADLKKRLGII